MKKPRSQISPADEQCTKVGSSGTNEKVKALLRGEPKFMSSIRTTRSRGNRCRKGDGDMKEKKNTEGLQETSKIRMKKKRNQMDRTESQSKTANLPNKCYMGGLKRFSSNNNQRNSAKKRVTICIYHIYFIYLHQISEKYGSNSKNIQAQKKDYRHQARHIPWIVCDGCKPWYQPQKVH